MILTDHETKVDLLNNEAIATTIVALLQEHPDNPITVGVHGDWGAGKSSILEMVEAKFENQPDALCLKFNGWRFQGFEDAKIALIEGIVTGLLDQRPALTKTSETVRNVFRHIDWLKAAKHAGGLAFTVATGVPTPGMVEAVVNAVKTPGGVEEAINGVSSIVSMSNEATNVPQEIEAFRKSFDDLLRAANIKQLIVLIDDLDRCLPDTAIETLEAVRLFVFTKRTAFVIGADEAMIEYAVRKHFPDLPDTTGPQAYARSYLEKLIQVPFRIPALGDMETRTYVTLLLVGTVLGDNTSAFKELIDVARERLRRPWESDPLDAAAISDALGEKTDKLKSMLTLSEQVGPILASGTKGNPRQIKRFLNALVLRQRTAEARGFGDEVKLPVLAKLMLAERFLPTLFDQIAATAASSPDGICTDLSELESAAGADNPFEPQPERPIGGSNDAASTDQAKTAESARLQEWLSSSAICTWAKVQPELGKIDLLPYIFITKDQKDFFGPASVLGHLSTIVKQLFGNKFQIQAIEADLQRLAPPEAEQVFEAVRARIIASGIFETEPPGADGIKLLVKSHRDLQPKLIDFLDSLPTDRLGPWVCGGWEGTFSDAQFETRFDALLKKWAERGGALLKATAKTVRKTPQRKG